ncbi:DNA cytosine methyltransferase [Vibrio splendidus]
MKATMTLNAPDLITKQLTVTQYDNGKHKLQISSNFLRLIGLEPNVKVVERSLGPGQGYEIVPASVLDIKPKKVYEREYKQRRNNPLFEAMTETTRHDLMHIALSSAKTVHVTLTHCRVLVKPVMDLVAQRVSRFLKGTAPYRVFSALTSGVDAHAATNVGFDVNAVLDYRPDQKRDLGKKQDLTESGVMSIMNNLAPSLVFNEDIYTVNPHQLAFVMGDRMPDLMTCSPQCSDFTPVKSKVFKNAHYEDLSTTLDMVHPLLNLVNAVQPVSVMLEQVKGFGQHAMGQLWELTMKRKGYFVHQTVLDARDHEGITGRQRHFSFATSLDAPFEWPEPTPRRNTPLWDEFIAPRLSDFRDITDTESMKKARAQGRLRAITPYSNFAPTLLRSQSRQCKDSCVIETHDGRILFPDEALLRTLMTLPDSFRFDTCSKEIATEILGQGVDYTLYERIMQSVQAHFDSAKAQYSPMTQLSLFARQA